MTTTGAVVVAVLGVLAVGVAALGGRAAVVLGQPRVIGEIAAGLALGVVVASTPPAAAAFAEVRSAVDAIAQSGVALFLALAAVEMRAAPGRAGPVATVAAWSFFVPLVAGTALGLTFLPWAQAVFLGAAMAVTALPVLARLLGDAGLVATPLGRTVLSAATVTDALCWVVIIGLAAAVGGSSWALLLVAPYGALLRWVVRPAVVGLAARRGTSDPVVLLLLVVGLAASCAATSLMGLHAFVGAFAFGLVVPPDAARWAGTGSLVGQVLARTAMPVFFVVAGVHALHGLTATSPVLLVLLPLVAILTKSSGAYLGARAAGSAPREAARVAVLLDTRGLTEVAVLEIGRRLGLVPPGVFAAMLLTALVSTALTAPALRMLGASLVAPAPRPVPVADT